ncbi:transcription/translation regulatory transformer protein RfaH [Pseudomonas massiliensis]|uniref:transcription/translation regulatory transformer protein RfaH n=1 Tax=Pseudomonas massiliensis TaxID=522492 RepID=UPI00058FF87D|nr:transcription/translation regulatory transformer protein RfaH [Pseudomonas massiliensis]
MDATVTRTNANWYLIQTKPRQEARAEEHLVRQGFTCYRPLQPLAQRANRLLEQPLFPGYLFIRMERDANWYPIRSTRGVCRIVAFGPQPCPVSEHLIAGIRQRAALDAAPQPFEQGEKVRVIAGGSELEAIFLCNDGDERAVILLTLLQRQQRVVLPRHSLQRVASHAY